MTNPIQESINIVYATEGSANVQVVLSGKISNTTSASATSNTTNNPPTQLASIKQATVTYYIIDNIHYYNGL